jgi:hypothetical protein
MANPGTELASLDFGNLIGGPLTAVITAQSMAARSTADFIKTVGFDKDNKPIYVDFKYPKELQPYQPAIAAVAAAAAVGDPAYPNGMIGTAHPAESFTGTGTKAPVAADPAHATGFPVYVPAVAAAAAVPAVPAV